MSVCDDGSITEKARDSKFREFFSLTELAPKTVWRNPCVPLNRAVRATDSELILLQSPETYHPAPVLSVMLDRMENKRTVVLCPTRCIGQKRMPWYAHPVHRPVKYWFCQLMTREFFEEVGGMNEQFREGQGYDDDAFVLALDRAGAVWRWADGEVVHVKVQRSHPMPSLRTNRLKYVQLVDSKSTTTHSSKS